MHPDSIKLLTNKGSRQADFSETNIKICYFLLKEEIRWLGDDLSEGNRIRVRILPQKDNCEINMLMENKKYHLEKNRGNMLYEVKA